MAILTPAAAFKMHRNILSPGAMKFYLRVSGNALPVCCRQQPVLAG